MPKNFIALDLEMNQPSHRIVQVGVCIGRPSQAEFISRKWYVDPGEPISAEITALTGIDDARIAAEAVPCAQVAAELGAVVLEHACFVNPVTWGGGDMGMLLEWFRKNGVAFPHFGRRWLDVKTMHGYLRMANGKTAAGGLGSAMGCYKLQFVGKAHRADVDALNTLRLFFKLLDRQRALEDMAALGRTV